MINAEWFSMIKGKCLFCKLTFRKREEKYKFCSLTCANNFNKNGLIRIDLPEPSALLAEFIGICLGDGYVSKYQTAITLNTIADRDYVAYVITLIKKLFPEIKITKIKRLNENAIDIRINSSIISGFLLNMGIIPNKKTVPNWIFKRALYRKACVRGLFDTEGSISFKLYLGKARKSLYKQLNFKNTNKNLILFVRDTLLSQGLRPTITLNKSLYISNDRDISLFRNKIGFGNPKLQERSLISNVNNYNEWRNDMGLT